jgi:hypothetical protein
VDRLRIPGRWQARDRKCLALVCEMNGSSIEGSFDRLRRVAHGLSRVFLFRSRVREDTASENLRLEGGLEGIVTEQFDVIVIGTGAAASSVAMRCGRAGRKLRLLIQGPSAVLVLYGGAIPRRYWWGQPKPLTGFVA